ncbi:hypothetical protein BUALT_Bualt10G0045900 [Buddleja alternifolia]|uniref:Uncharacterized protein n=1 Tax=Buddleja alternifolia TaxID=168488 RepID=A0AAV6WV94_9LAMI|nr:hypothetical protein BUALT_Bualt10G0045900 [Buddleja alternifolia]
MASVTTISSILFVLFLASVINMAESRKVDILSPIGSPRASIKAARCLIGYGACPDVYECKYRCYKQWEPFNPEGYCDGYPLRLCYCSHDCAKEKVQ